MRRVDAAALAELIRTRQPCVALTGAGISTESGIPKPGVVMFGELLPEGALTRAERLAEQAELLLVVGSTLEVWPVAGLPELTLRRGGALAIVNRGPTALDHRADLRLEGGAGETLSAVVAALR